MLAQRPAAPTASECPETQARPRLWLLPLILVTALSGCASGLPRPATVAAPEGFEVRGRIALVPPDIALSERHADGITVPRQEWTAAARLLCAQATHEVLESQSIAAIDYAAAAGADDPRLLERLLAAAGDGTGSTGGRTGASVQTEVAPILHATGADFALIIRFRASHASEGRAAVRAAGRLLLGGDIGGDAYEGAALLVDLRSGQRVWERQLDGANNDLRTLAGARNAVAALLAGLHGPEGTPPGR